MLYLVELVNENQGIAQIFEMYLLTCSCYTYNGMDGLYRAIFILTASIDIRNQIVIGKPYKQQNLVAFERNQHRT